MYKKKLIIYFLALTFAQKILALEVKLEKFRQPSMENYPVIIYLSITNENETTDVLRSINSNYCAKINLYKTIIDQGVKSIIPINSLAIPAFSSISFITNKIFISCVNKLNTSSLNKEFSVDLYFENAKKITINQMMK